MDVVKSIIAVNVFLLLYATSVMPLTQYEGIPPRPTILYWRNVDWHICIRWSRNAATLPVSYHVKYRCLSDCELDDEGDLDSNGWHEVCRNTGNAIARQSSCCLNHVTMFVNYEAVVVAQNAVGSATSLPVNFTRGIRTAIGPPSSLQAKPSGFGEITLDWTPRLHTYWKVHYIIFYHAQTDSKNKTITLVSGGQNHYRLTGLQPFTNYTLYVTAVGSLSGAIGIPAGPVTIATREENPYDAPEITDWSSNVDEQNPKIRNVTMYWKLPSKEKWNGKLKRFIIQYRKVAPLSKQVEPRSRNPWGESLVIDNGSASKATVVGLMSACAYKVEMQMCNGAGCGGIGNRVIVQMLHIPDHTASPYAYHHWLMIASTAGIGLLLVIIVLVYITLKSSRLKQSLCGRTCIPQKGTSDDRMDVQLV